MSFEKRALMLIATEHAFRLIARSVATNNLSVPAGRPRPSHPAPHRRPPAQLPLRNRRSMSASITEPHVRTGKTPPCISSLRRPAEEPGQLRAADAADLHRARGLRLSRTSWPSCTASSAGPGKKPTPAAAGSPPPCPATASARTTPSPIIAPNTPPMYEAAFGVPMCGAVLNTLNTRLDAEAIAFQLRHGGAKVPDHRPRVLRHHRTGPGAARRQAPRHRHRRPRPPRRQAARRNRIRSLPRPRATPTTPGRTPPTNGTPSPSATPPAPPATPRASSPTIAAPI